MTQSEYPTELDLAAYALWCWNGHDVLASLFGVSRRHLNPTVREQARQAYDTALVHGVAGFTHRFTTATAVEDSATRQRTA